MALDLGAPVEATELDDLKSRPHQISEVLFRIGVSIPQLYPKNQSKGGFLFSSLPGLANFVRALRTFWALAERTRSRTSSLG